MFDFIPLEYYTAFYFHFLLVIASLIVFNSWLYRINDNENITFLNITGYFTFLIIILYMGMRPIVGKVFGDMGYYYMFFKQVAAGSSATFGSDVFFSTIIRFLSIFIAPENMFLALVLIYTVPLYIFSFNYFRKFWFLAFFMFISTMSFWAYGTNGVRNGMATSVFILGLCFYNKKIVHAILLLFSMGIHGSMVLPVGAFFLAEVYQFFFKNKYLFIFWIIAIPVSLISGSFWSSFFAKLADDDRTAYLTGEGIDTSIFSSTGFRWDFLLYSSIPVAFGYYYVYIKKFEDKFYTVLLNCYLIANAFWILVISAPYSNRFAYLSWFIMAPVIFYPFAKVKLWEDHNRIIGYIIVGYFLFTYLFIMIK